MNVKLRRSSYANVTATLALVVALSGTSYAAVVITGADIKNGSIKTADLARNAVISKKVKNGSLLAKDFKAGQLPGAFAAGNESTVAVSGETTVLTLAVPAGSYVVNAKADVANFDSVNTVLARCTLTAGAAMDQVRFRLMEAAQTPRRMDTAAVALQLATTFDSAGSVVLTCDTFGVSTGAARSKITATEVADVTEPVS